MVFFITNEANKDNLFAAKIINKDGDYIAPIYIGEERIHKDPEKIGEIAEESEYKLFPYFSDLYEKEQNHRLIVSGKSGSGKSYTIGKMLDQYASLTRKSIIILSWVNQDEPLDQLRPVYNKLSKTVTNQMPRRINLLADSLFDLTPEYFADTIVVFDDVEKGVEKERIKFINSLRSMLYELGRHHDIDLISVSHDILGGNANKTIKNESTGIFLYPQHNSHHQMISYLTRNVGLTKDQIEEIKKINSRWVYIHLNAPMYWVSDKKIKLLV